MSRVTVNVLVICGVRILLKLLKIAAALEDCLNAGTRDANAATHRNTPTH